MKTLNNKIIAQPKRYALAGIVKETGLSHDFLNSFFDYYSTCTTIVSIYKQYNLPDQDHKQKTESLSILKDLINELKKLRLVTCTDWVLSKDNADGHLAENKRSIEQIDRAIFKIQKLIDQEWDERVLFTNFKAVVSHFNENVHAIIDPSRPPQRDILN